MSGFKKVKQETIDLKIRLPIPYRIQLESYCLTHKLSLKAGVMKGIELLAQQSRKEGFHEKV